MNRNILFRLFLICLLTCVSAGGIRAEAAKKSGKCGSHATYIVTEDETLVIQGKGAVTKGDIWVGLTYKKVMVEEGITELCDGALAGIFTKEIELPKSLKKIGKSCFASCHELTSIQIPSKVKDLPEDTFYYCEKLKEIVLPNHLKSIGSNAFEKCKHLKKLDIPSSVQTIGKNAFYQCNMLRQLTLPKKLKKIGTNFVKCGSLRKIINKSRLTIPLDNAEGARTWKVGGKKRTSVSAGRTAVTKGNRYRVRWHLRGGTAQGKLPKYYYYGDTPKMPNVTKKGYVFIGWRNYNEVLPGEKFPAYCDKDVRMVAFLVKYKVKALGDGKLKVTIQDDNLEFDYGYDPGDDYLYYVIRVSQNEDMSDSTWFATKKSTTISGLEPGKMYYVDFTYFCGEIEDEDDLEDGWYFKRAVMVT